MDIVTFKLDEDESEESNGFLRTHIFNESNTGCGAISLEHVRLPKGSESTPHAHVLSHTVVFTLTGSVKVYYGANLERHVVVRPRECIYIPPNVIHHVVNEDDEAMTAVVARTPSRNVVVEFDHLTVSENLHPAAPPEPE